MRMLSSLSSQASYGRVVDNEEKGSFQDEAGEMAQPVRGLGTSMRTQVLILRGHTGKSDEWL